MAKSAEQLKDEGAFLALAETLPALIALIQGDKIIYVNPAACTMLGYPKAQFVGRNFWDVVHPAHREEAKARGRARQAGVPQPRRFVERLVHADGRDVWMDYSVDVMELDGRVTTLVTGYDVTERRRMEEELRLSEERFRGAFENASVGKAIARGDGRFVQVNRALCAMLGYPEAELLALGLEEIAHPDDRPAVREAMRRLAAGGAAMHSGEQRVVHRDGRAVWVNVAFTIMRCPDGTCFMAEFQDVTERKRAMELLRDREARLAEAQQVAHIGSWAWDIAANRVAWSDELFRIYGRDPSTFEASYEGFLACLHPDDRAIAARTVERALEDGRPFEYEHRVIRPSGEVRVLLGRGCVEKDASGRPVRMYGTGQDITERKRAEEALRRSEERFREIYRNSPVMMCTVDAEDRIRDVNECWLRTLGYAREEVVGRPGFDFVAPQQRACMRAAWDTRTRTLVNHPLQLARKDGGIVDLLTTTVPELDEHGRPCGAICVSIDITALRESEARYRTLVEFAPEAIIVGDADTGKFVDVNSQTEAMFGIPRDRLLTLGPVECSPPVQPNGRPSAEAARELIDRALRGETVAFEWVHLAAGDREFPCRIHMTRMPAAGRNLVRATITDISHEKRLQEQLRHQEKMAAMGVLAAGVAHEIGNPLLALSMAAQSIEKRTTDEYAVRKLALIREHIDRISKIVRQMNDLARPQSVKLTRTCLNRTIERALEVARFDRRAKDVEIKLDLGDIPWITAIEDQLTQVCLNLALNAFDAMSANPAERPRQLRVATRAENGRVVATFEDTGPGVAAEHQERLFQPFFTTKQRGHGTGLGLSVSHRIVLEHGGELTYATRPGGGARFTVDLPVRSAP